MSINFLKHSLFILSIVAFGSLFGSSHVNAQSAYDDVIVTADKPQLLDKQGNIVDVSTTWFGIIEGREHILEELNLNNYSSNSSFCDFYPSERAAWALTQVYDQNGQPNGLNLFWIDNKNDFSLTFYENSSGERGLIVPPTEQVNICRIESNYYLSSHTTRVTSSNNITSVVEHLSSRDFAIAHNATQVYYSTHPVLINWDIDYPPDYDGVIPPDSIDLGTTAKIGVSIRGSVANDVVSVEWYEDPNNPAPAEAKGIYLMLHNTNFDPDPPECSNDNIQNWRHSLTEIAVFDPVPCYGVWYIQSQYTYDEQGQDIIPNTDKTSLNLRVDGSSFFFDYDQVEFEEDGTITSPPLGFTNLEECMVFTDQIPWFEIEYKKCFENIQQFIGIAENTQSNVSDTFKEITLPIDGSCGSLTIVNNWINLPQTSNHLCPQFPSDIRRYITLFTVFLLYIGVIFGYLHYQGRDR